MKPRRNQLLALILIISFLINPILATANAGNTPNLSGDLFTAEMESKTRKVEYKINVLYDSSDSTCSKAAANLKQELSSSGLSLNMVPVENKDTLFKYNKGSEMNIYIFHGTERGMLIDSQLVYWQTLNRMLTESKIDNHIFQVCHSDILEILNGGKSVHGLQGSTDREIAIFGALSSIYETLNASTNPLHKPIAETMFDTTSMYLLTNLNTILQRGLEPRETLDGFYIDTGTKETDSRGPWGWIIDVIMDLLLITGFTSNDWFTNTNSTHIEFDDTAIKGGATDRGSLEMEDMGKGNSETGEFPFDIPLDFDVTPRIGTGPWYMPDYVDLTFTVKAKDGKLDLAKVTGLEAVMKAAGYDVKLELTPKLSATLRIGNFIDQLANANPAISGNPFKFMGGSLSIELGFELGIPLATFLDYLIPGTGKTVKTIMDTLNMKVNLVNYLSLALGMNYNSTTEASAQDITLKVGFGLDISLKLPSPASYIKKAIGVSLPLDFIKLGMVLKAKTGIIAKASFGHKGDSFKVGLFYNLFFKFYASLFWIFKFDVTKEWKDTIWFLEIAGETGSPAPTNDHANLDLDDDGLWDDLEVILGLDPTVADTDGDHLSDGNEFLNYFTDPLNNDTDSDGLLDDKELALFYAAGLDPLADYDNDGKPCIMDYDSDNDGINDKDELIGRNSAYWSETNLKTNPSLPDTDFDGFTDLEEWSFAGPALELPHPDPRNKDSDSDGLWDWFEYNWFEFQYGISDPATRVLLILNPDSDGEGLLDGEEFNYHTSALDIDTDGDYDLNDDNIITITEHDAVINNGNYGDFTDYGEIHGNTWLAWPFGMDDCIPPNPTITSALRADTDYDGISDADEYTADSLPVVYDNDADGIENSADLYDFHANCTNPDADADGIQDGIEVNYFNLTRGISNLTIQTLQYLNDSDVDDDGVLDGHELRIGCDPLNNDTDFDGLLDGEELEVGSNPLVEDSDGDGLLDGFEVHVLHTSPLRKDTDNDGLPDSFEAEEQTLYILYQGNVTYFTDPNDPDSDDDGITDGEEYYGWNWALDRRVAPAALVIDEPIIHEGDEDVLIQLYNAPDPYRARFQTNPMNPDTDFDGLPDGLEKDIVLSPLTNDTDADGWLDIDEIAEMETRFSDTWDNVPDIWHYLDYDQDGVSDFVEMQRGTNMLMPDTDMDGLDDWTELFVAASIATQDYSALNDATWMTIETNTTLPANKRYTDPTEPDTDFDGLNDYWEIQNGTDPTHADSDLDGLSDYEEIVVYHAYEGLTPHRVSLDPLNNDTDSDGLSDLDEVIICQDRMAASGNPEHGPLGDFDNDGVVNILDYDSDDDGIYDSFEVNDYDDPSLSWYPIGTDMFDANQGIYMYPDGFYTDYDGDGLSDYLELSMIIPGYTYGGLENENTTARGYFHLLNHTLVTLEDTDSDGYNDGYEINFGSDPINSDSVPVTLAWTIPELGFVLDFWSSSQIEDLMFDAEDGAIEFDVVGPDHTYGFCNISIPQELLYSPTTEWEVFLDDVPLDFTAYGNDTVTLLHFEYMHSTHHVVISGLEMTGPSGFDPMMLILIGSLVGVVFIIILVFALKKKKT